MNAAAVLRVIVEAQTGPASASLAKFDGQLAATAANADRAMGRVAGSTAKAEAAAKRMQATGRTVAGVGKAIGLATVPLALFGAASAKASMDYTRAMELIHTQAGATQKEVGRLEKSVLALARHSPQGPTELANALFRLEGAGLRGKKAMDALRASSKLAMVGGADVEETAKTLSQVWFTDIKGAEDFKRVVAEVNATVGAGDLRLPQLVDALGTGVLASAKGVGLSLQDVNGALAVFGDETNNVSGWSAQLATAFHFLTNPTDKAKGALESMGLTGSSLAQDLHKHHGLLTALTDLRAHLDKLPGGREGVAAGHVLGDILPGGRGRVLLVLLNQLDRYEQKMKQIKGTTDRFGDAVKRTNEQPAVKLEKAWSSIQADMVEIGGSLLPILVPGFEHLAHFADGAMHAFSAMPPGLQSAAVEAGLISIGLAGGLIVTGKLITALGTLREAMGGLALMQAGGALFGDLKAASTLALGGEMGGFRMMGADAAKALGGGLVAALPLAIAGAGLVNVASSAMHGDWESVGYKSGGALVGGIAGAFLGPEGALIGAGIGTFIGGLLAPAQHHAETLAEAMSGLREASQGLQRSEGSLKSAKEREREATHGQARAEEHLQDLRKSHAGTGAIHRAELNVIQSRQRAKKATDAVCRSEEHLEEFRALKGEKAGVVFHRTSFYIAKEQQHLDHLKRLIQEEGKTPELAEKREEALKRLIGWEHQRNVALEAARKFNKGWAASLESMDTVQQRFGTNGIVLVRRLQEQSEHLADLKQKVQGVPRDVIPPSWRSDLERTEAKLGRTRHAIEDFSKRTGTSLGGASGAVAKFSGDSSASYESLAETAGRAMQNIIANTAGASKALGAGPVPSFSLKMLSGASQHHHQREAAQTGLQNGGFTVPGNSSGDRHPYRIPHGSFVMNRKATAAYGLQDGGGVPVVLESRERVFMPHEVAAIGAGNLAAMNAAVPRFQKGGQLGPEPQIAGPGGALRAVGQAAVHQVYKGAQHYLAQHKSSVLTPGGGGAVMAQIARVLFANGFNKVAAAGIIGNAYRESSLNPAAVGTGGGGLWGFTSGAISLAALQAAARRAGTPWTSVPFQTGFMLRHGGMGLRERLNSAGSAAEAARIFMEDWERPGIPAQAEREAAARRALAQGYQRGGAVGVRKRENEGAPETRKEYVARVRHLAHRAWSALGRNRAPEPTISVDGSTTFGTDHLTGHIHIPEHVGGSLLARHPILHSNWAKRALVHEFAHTMQKTGIRDSIPEREGGASWFADIEAPGVWSKLRFPYKNGPPSYSRYLNLVQHEHNRDWAMHGQFKKFQRGGAVGLAAGGSPSGGKPMSMASLPMFLRSGGTGPADATHVVKWAQAHLGQTRDYGYPGEWCGAFVGADMQAHGIQPPSGYPLAANWAGWGKSDSSPLYGDVVVIGGSGHVGIALGGNRMISGNFSSKVAESTIGEAAGGRPILGYRTPPYTHTDSKNPHETKAQEVAHTYKEPVPAVFHGCRTDSLHFGSMPKTLQGVEKEIGQRSRELGQYRRVAKLAAEKNRPAIAQALKHNITALETRLKQLRDERTKLRHEVVKKRYSRKLHRALAKVTGYEQLIEARQRDYNIASQNIEQIVGLEPQEPILPASATDQQREAAEKNYLGAYESYVEGTERPAFQDILGKEADWRNTILRAEYFGFGKGQPSVSALEWHWEGKIYEVGTEIENIDAYTERVKADLEAFHQQHPKAKQLPDALKKEIAKRDQMRAKLPTLRAQDAELRKVLGEGRALFYPGVKNGVPVSPPDPPLPGTGSFEDALIEVQGIHWPDQHSLLPASALAPPRVAGKFGGAIWDTQSSIEELGIKIQQAAAGIGGGGDGSASEGKSERERLLETLLHQAAQREAINTALGPTLAQFKATYPFMGAFAKGGVALVGETGPEIAHFPSGTRIHSADDTRRMLGSSPTTVVIERLHIDRDGRVTLDAKDPNVRAVVKEVIDDTRSPMSTPGSFSSGFRP